MEGDSDGVDDGISDTDGHVLGIEKMPEIGAADGCEEGEPDGKDEGCPEMMGPSLG